MSARLKRIARSGLNQLGLARRPPVTTSATQRDEYWQQLVNAYSNPLSRPREDFTVLAEIETASENAVVNSRFEKDRQVLIHSILGHMLSGIYGRSDRKQIPLDDIVTIVKSRHSADDGMQPDWGRAVLQALAALSSGDALLDWSLLPGSLKEVLGESSIGPVIDEEETQKKLNGSPVDQERANVVGSMLDCLIEDDLIPRFNDYDYLDDIVPIIESRYVADGPPQAGRSRGVLQALSAVTTNDPLIDRSLLPAKLRTVLGQNHKFVPARGTLHPDVHKIIPDLVEEFIALKAENNVERFLEINRAYSSRQHEEQGEWSNRDLSLLRGYERNHHLLLRSLIGLIRDGKIKPDDEALILGPRHIDELYFFQKYLGLPNTFGLDLFPSYEGRIVAGDMHDMPFESDRFRVVYSCNTLTYAYNARKVIDEMARVLKRPGYVFLIDSGERVPGPDPLGRSDLGSVGSAIRCFYKHNFKVIAQDSGRSLNPLGMKQQPCLAIELY